MWSTTDHPVLEELDREECLALLGGASVGRIGYDDGQGPAVVPVNFVLDGETVVFRTTVTGRLNRSLHTALSHAAVRVAFEVDDIDEESRTGWSVLVRGGARQMGEDEGAPVEPWPGEEHDAHIRLTPVEISGRRLRRP